jgi:hypothetical protein
MYRVYIQIPMKGISVTDLATIDRVASKIKGLPKITQKSDAITPAYIYEVYKDGLIVAPASFMNED